MDSLPSNTFASEPLSSHDELYARTPHLSSSETLAPTDSYQISPSEPAVPIPSPEIGSPKLNPPVDSHQNDGIHPNRSGPGKDNSSAVDEWTGRRRRRSRWEPPVEPESRNGETGGDDKRRKSRWADEEPKPAFQLPEFMKDFIGGMDIDPEIQALNARLLEINRLLQSGLPLDDRPEGTRSPSPEPIYDNNGIRINTREFRARENLNRERQVIISQIIKRNPAFKPPADYRPPKLQKKLYIPLKEYPGYNFIGLIIGPRGNTQKRMEKETGAKIVIRGKGSMKEGKWGQKKDLKYDPAEYEDLHVLVEAETQESLDAGVGMVEKILQPVDEGLNEHKRQQLRELAALNGTIREDEFCRLCGEPGHRQYACPSRMSTFMSDVLCKICGDGGHPTIDCPVKGTTGKKMDDEYQNFLAELGGTIPESLTKQSTALLITGSNNSGSDFPWAAGNIGSKGSSAHPGLGSNVSKIGKEIDDTNLYIGFLPPTFDDDALIRLFSPFGEIVMAKVIKDRVTGLGKGYGFVKYSDVAQANQAITSMNGFRLDGRTIAVRVAGKPPQPTFPLGPPAPQLPYYLGQNQPLGVYSVQQPTSGGALGSASPDSYITLPVPWGPPPSYPHYAPAVSNVYPPFQTQPMPSYGAQYPPSMQSATSVTPQDTSSVQAPQSNAPGVQTRDNMPAQSASNNTYENPMTAFPTNSQTTYPHSSFEYSSYYAATPPPPPVDQQDFVGFP